MDDLPDPCLEPAVFAQLQRAYRERWHIPLIAVGLDGRVQLGVDGIPGLRVTQDLVEHLLGECLRWGEPTIHPSEPGTLSWGLPVMWNARLLGGLIAFCPEQRVFAEEGQVQFDLRAACADLRHRGEEANLVNAALLELRRVDYLREQDRAYVLHDAAKTRCVSIHEAYLREEPALLSAIRQGDAREAIGIINRILLIIYREGADNLNVVKSYVMELVASMCRAAVEAGGEVGDLLGVNFRALSELGAVNDEEALSAWLVNMLHRIMEVIANTGRRRSTSSQVQAGINYIEAHYDEPLGRDQVAHVAGLSPSHFSRVLKEKTGKGFSDLLNQVRIDHAAILLRGTDKGLVHIALETGFSDQSYFTKVFRKHTGLTPREYRLRHRNL